MIELRRLTEADGDALWAILADPEVWRLMPIPLGSDRMVFDRYLDVALNDPAAEVYAVLRDGEVVGTSRLRQIDLGHRKAELGYTWYRRDQWGTDLNPAAKLHLLTRAFDELGLLRVFFNVDVRNARSRAAVAKLGAIEEGILRSDRLLPDGHRRDTAVSSILAEEWPAVRERLTGRL